MCGRYYIDDDMAKEIEKLVRQVDKSLQMGHLNKDIHPTEIAPVLAAGRDGMQMIGKQWGFPGIQKKGVIFNARSETVLEKRMFRESIMHRRIVIPAVWFYEWNSRKEKVLFFREDRRILYMAGFYKQYEEEDRFVILTTQANASMKETHDRMPLILEREELEDWIMEDSRTELLLRKRPAALDKKAEYEQQSFL